MAKKNDAAGSTPESSGGSSPDISILLPDLRVGGAENMRLTLCKEFLRRGHKVEFALLSAEGELLDQLPKQVTVANLKVQRFRLAFFPIVRYLRTRRPKVLLAALWPLTSLAVWAGAASRSGCRVVVSEHGMLSLSPFGRPGLPRIKMRAAARLSHPFASRVIAASSGIADDLVFLSGVNREKIDVVWNPVTPLPPAGRAQKAVAGPWLSHAGPKIIAVGRMKAVKDYPTLLEAFARLRSTHDAMLIILGDGQERARLQELVKEKRLDGKVLMPGFVENPHAYVAKADVFALSSTSEGFGNVIVEALACGVPVVSTDCPAGPREILDDGRFGRLVPVGDPMAMSKAIAESLEERRAPRELIIRSQAFSISQAAEGYLHAMFPAGHALPAQSSNREPQDG